jgi:hypothetical protein
MASFHQRLIGAACLRSATYEDVEHDASATLQAAIVVAIASFTSSVAWYFGTANAWLIVSGAARALIGWLAGAAVLWVIGTRLLPGRDTEADLGQLLRTVGFAQTPGLFGVLAVVPVVGLFVPFMVAMWVIAATVVAVRQALDYDSTFRAVLVCLLGLIVSVIVVYVTGFGATVVH